MTLEIHTLLVVVLEFMHFSGFSIPIRLSTVKHTVYNNTQEGWWRHLSLRSVLSHASLSFFFFFWCASTFQVHTDASGFMAWLKVTSTMRAFSISLEEKLRANLQYGWRYLFNSQLCGLVALKLSWLSHLSDGLPHANRIRHLFHLSFLAWVLCYKQENLWVLFCKQENLSTSSSRRDDACTMVHLHSSRPARDC